MYVQYMHCIRSRFCAMKSSGNGGNKISRLSILIFELLYILLSQTGFFIYLLLLVQSFIGYMYWIWSLAGLKMFAVRYIELQLFSAPLLL